MAAILGLATPLFAADIPPGLAEPHLSSLPRSRDEAARVARVTAPTGQFDSAEPFEDNPAGAATVPPRSDREAYSAASGNLTFEQGLEFHLGEALFDKLWVFAPASTLASDGLGPIYNARSCQRCHIRDGRGHLPDGPDYRSASTFLRLSVPGPVPPEMAAIPDYIGTAPDPVYGWQMQDFSAPGVDAEYRLEVTFTEDIIPLNGGEQVSLRRPRFRPAELRYGPLDPAAMLSARVAPPMIGLGLLEAIPAADILALADPDDADGDGISGRANLVWSTEFQQILLGRFGLKAGTATIHEQSAAALSGDIGISTPLFAHPFGDCTPHQTACRAARHGDKDKRGTEIDQPNMDLITFYSRNIAVPARRDVSAPEVLRGKAVFYTAGCADCHRPKFVTHRLLDRAEQSFQLIWPYSDLLLHDMGEDLADHRPEGRATGREWRTAPLWGIGLAQQVSDKATFLHDGRARTLLEAILWHGGEAQPARDHIVALPPEDRAALITFLESL
ncbi:cytochrome c [Tritonibacter horizontis]|uniref:Cytochrome c n=1 Tax=Tritonibacter horizontis TaxID=1768241 RepID=A0A132BUZ3_9RHOB|nr:di-heme oxidoredictase family protein [Tritonibacter horizontis]KUP92016.1 cytochrome c [Tritonibacter horizontis]